MRCAGWVCGTERGRADQKQRNGEPDMALTANREIGRYVDQELRTYRVLANVHIYKGGLVGVDRATGYARPLVLGDAFAGVAYEEIDNTGGSNGAKSCRVFT